MTPIAWIVLVLGIAFVAVSRPVDAETVAATEVYRQHCAVCHGAGGRGDGAAAGMLVPHPRDFSTGRYKFRSTPTGTLPAIGDVVRTIAGGLRGTSMPAFADVLAPSEIEAVARYVLSLAPKDARVAPPMSVPADARGDGAALFARAGCDECHGAEGRGSAWRTEGAAPWGGRPATRLDEPWTFRGGADEEAIAHRILSGLDGTAMPAYEGALTDTEARAVARHVRTLARAPIWEERDPARISRSTAGIPPAERGRYLVHAMQCPLCHTPISATTGAYDTRLFLAGGMRVSAWPWGVWYSRNLTPDHATGLGGWSEDAIVGAITRGVRPDGTRLDPIAMPWPWFSRLTPADARAIAAYLRTLPPIANAVPAAEPFGFAERVGGKLLTLARGDGAIAFWGGNAAAPATAAADVAPPERRRAARWLGWGALLFPAGFGTLALVLRPRRPRRTLLAGGVAGGIAWISLGAWPPFALVSPEQTTRWLFLGSPALASATAPSDARHAFAQRGEYLVTIAPCGLCHTPVDAFAGFLTGRTLAGGMDARWRVYGRAVASNLTPHPDGIAGASDDALLRAMASGIGRDGRALHWQAMPWDLTSNWSEEDRRAMIAYLRALPPVPGRVPAPRPPSPDDPAADTFGFGDHAIR